MWNTARGGVGGLPVVVGAKLISFHAAVVIPSRLALTEQVEASNQIWKSFLQQQAKPGTHRIM